MTLKSPPKEYLADIEGKIPELATSADLVRLKLFGSEAALCKARKNGNSPDYIQISPGKIRYPRAAVINFFKARMIQGTILQNQYSYEGG
jgi:hypothetical protein